MFPKDFPEKTTLKVVTMDLGGMKKGHLLHLTFIN